MRDASTGGHVPGVKPVPPARRTRVMGTEDTHPPRRDTPPPTSIHLSGTGGGFQSPPGGTPRAQPRPPAPPRGCGTEVSAPGSLSHPPRGGTVRTL